MDYLEVQAGHHATSANANANANGNSVPSSSSSVASRLYLNGQRNSQRNSFSSEPELINLEGDGNLGASFNDVSTQMSAMSKRLTDLQELHMATIEEKGRLKSKNDMLQQQVHHLEEQLHASEQLSKKTLEEEKQKFKDMLAHFERERQLESDTGTLRYKLLEKDLEAARRENERLNSESAAAQDKLARLEDQVSDLRVECETLSAEKRQLAVEFERYRADATDRIENNEEILEELMNRQSESHLRDTNPTTTMMRQQGSLAEQIVLLEDEIERLRVENRELRDQNRDLQAQLFHDSVQCGRTLLADGPPSLAAELGGMDSQELRKALCEQELCNQRLRNYVNGILMRILERHPDILEIDSDNSVATGIPPHTATGTTSAFDEAAASASSTSSSAMNKCHSHPASPPNSAVSTIKRSAAERLSLRFWYGGGDAAKATGQNGQNTDAKNNCSSNHDNGSHDGLAKRLYHSLWDTQNYWRVFGGSGAPSAKTDAEGECPVLSELKTETVEQKEKFEQKEKNMVDEEEDAEKKTRKEDSARSEVPPDPCPPMAVAIV